MAWNTRFKKASAARRRLKQGEKGLGSSARPTESGRPRVQDADISGARRANPRAYLESIGYKVEGNDNRGHLWIDDVLRVDRTAEGHWVACDWYGNGIGDNIALVSYFEDHKGFADAVYSLGGSPTACPAPIPTTGQRQAEIERPRLPKPLPEDIEAGRAYLRGRGISAETIAYGEKQGMLWYGPNGVFFVGRDRSGAARSATRRCIASERDATGIIITKRDLAWSDKTYPAVLPGDARKIDVVEGGVDALALHDLFRQDDLEPPTVIVSGGAGVLRWIDNPCIARLLQNAEEVTVWKENENTAQKQAQTDAAHDRQKARIAELRGSWESLYEARPPAGLKDIGEYYLSELDGNDRNNDHSRPGPTGR